MTKKQPYAVLAPQSGKHETVYRARNDYRVPTVAAPSKRLMEADSNESLSLFGDAVIDTIRPNLNDLYGTMEDVRKTKQNGLKALSLFSGGGGSGTGFRMAGWHEIGSVEFVKAAREAIKANYPDTHIIEPEFVTEKTMEWFAAHSDTKLPTPEPSRPRTIKGMKHGAVISWDDYMRKIHMTAIENASEAEIEAASSALFEEFDRMRDAVNESIFSSLEVGLEPCWGDDIRFLSPKAWMNYAGIKPGELDCLEGSPPCFPAGTTVLTRDGVKFIEDVEVGDLVLTHKGRWRAVTNVMQRKADTVYVDGGRIEATSDHPFYARVTEDAEPEWIAASEMHGKYYARMEDIDGQYITVWYLHNAVITTGRKNVTVYDITVDEDHSFVAEGYIVHNCKSFSMSGGREKMWGYSGLYSEERKQRTDDLFVEYMRMVYDFKPKSFIAENVSGLIAGDTFNSVFKPLLDTMTEYGYTVRWAELKADEYGVPQRRPRIFIIGIRNDILDKHDHPVSPEFPVPYPYSYTCGDALDASPEITPEEAKYFSCENAEAGKTWKLLKPGQSPVDKQFQLTRCSRNLPVPTITATDTAQVASAGPMHPDECRKFTIPELLRLFAYPTDYQMVGTFGQQGERIGRSVPPFLMKQLASSIASVLLSAKKGS